MTLEIDISTWPSKFEAARLLGIGERTLDRQIKRTGAPEVRMRPRDGGRKPEPVCNPDDVQRLISARNRAVAIPAETTSAVALRTGANGAYSEQLVRIFEALATIPQPGSGTSPLWMTLKQASRYSGLSMAMLLRLAATSRILALKDNGWKIWRGSLDELGARWSGA
jgi:hypothetical protein